MGILDRWFGKRKIGEKMDAPAKLEKPAVEPLIQALNDKDAQVRYEATEALGKIKDARVVEPLIRAMKDDNMSVQMMAAWALAEIGDAIGYETVEPPIYALNDTGILGRWLAERGVRRRHQDDISPPSFYR